MKKIAVWFPALVLGGALMAQAQAGPSKVGIINIQSAIISTKDGQKAANELQSKFAPKKAELEKQQNTIAQLQDQLRKGNATMSEDAKQKIMRDIDTGNTRLKRDTEDAQAELDQEQGRVMQELGQKMMQVINKYAKDNGYSLILDVSSPQTPVLFAANGTDITQEIVKLYDTSAAGGAAPTTSSAPASHPAAPPASRAAAPAPKK